MRCVAMRCSDKVMKRDDDDDDNQKRNRYRFFFKEDEIARSRFQDET